MSKFFVKNENITENREISIKGKDVNHIKNVLRKRIGDKINICNQETSENFSCKIVYVSENEIICNIEEKLENKSESNLEITIFQGLPKSDKMELIIQKATELGVKTIAPLDMKRTVVKLNDKDKIKKVKRWQTIAEVAAKQSGRDIIPTIEQISTIKDIDKNKYDLIIVLYECEEKNSIKTVINKLKNKNKILRIAIVIGPEGGIDETEIGYLRGIKSEIVTLGKRILRTETVALVVTGILMYELGDLN